MKRAVIAIVVIQLLAGVTVAQEGPGTKFRGLFVNMSKSDLDHVHLDEFEVRSRGQEATLSAKGKGVRCAVLRFDKAGRVEAMKLKPCFFRADDLTGDQFAQKVVDTFRIPSLDCNTQSLYSRDLGGSIVIKRCSGSVPTGELLHIEITTAGMFGTEITMDVVRRGNEKRPKFD